MGGGLDVGALCGARRPPACAPAAPLGPPLLLAHHSLRLWSCRLRLAHHVNEGKAKLGLGPRPPPQPRYQPLQQQSPHHYMPQLQRHADAARPAAALGASATGSSSSSGAAAGPPRAPPNFKTKLCIPYLHKNGACWHGDRCHFAHGERELRLHLRDEQAMQRELEAHGLRSMHAPDTPPLPPPPPHAQPHLTQPRQQLAPPPPGFSSFRSTPAAHQPAPALGAKPMSGAALADYLSTAARLEDDAPEWACCPITQVGGCRAWAAERRAVGARVHVAMRQRQHAHCAAASLCPASTSPARLQELLADPVVAADGHTYERAAIESWLAMRGTSPMTGAQLEDRRLLPNHALVSCMRATLGEHACSARRHTA